MISHRFPFSKSDLDLQNDQIRDGFDQTLYFLEFFLEFLEFLVWKILEFFLEFFFEAEKF